MPTYEYECSKCGVFELFQKMSDDPIQKCPSCRRKVKRLIGTGAGVIFKGSGFYETDYRSDSYKKAKEADSKPTASDSKQSDSKGGDAKKTDSKPASNTSAGKTKKKD